MLQSDESAAALDMSTRLAAIFLRERRRRLAKTFSSHSLLWAYTHLVNVTIEQNIDLPLERRLAARIWDEQLREGVYRFGRVPVLLALVLLDDQNDHSVLHDFNHHP